MLYVSALFSIELAFLVLASSSIGGIRLRSFVLLNMVLITIFGGIMMPPGMPASNIGCVFYSFALGGVMLLLKRHGAVAVVKILQAIFFNIVMLLGVAITLNAMQWEGPGASAYHEVLAGTYRFSYASLCAFIIGQALYVYLYRKLQHRSVMYYYVANILLVQIVDTAIFFPLAFGASAIDLFSIAMNGLLVKVSIGLLLAPFMIMLCRTDPLKG